MDKEYIRQKVEAWVAEEELPGNGTLKPIRKFDGLYPDEPEERDAWFDFINWSISREYAVLLSIPKTDNKKDFWQMDEGENAISYAFGSVNYQEQLPKFDRYHYRVKKVLEKIKDLSITHSCISNEDGKTNIYNRYKLLVENEFLNPAKVLYETMKKYPLWVSKHELLKRLTRHKNNIKRCKKIWEEYAYWE